jgi:hypothetical protein
VPLPEPEKSAPVPPAESPDEAADLLDDFLIALLELLGETWPDLIGALPDEVFERLDYYLDTLLSDGA